MGTTVAWAEDQPKNSGFLGDDSVYARLQEVEIHKGVKGKRWLAPHLNSENYQTALVDDVVLNPTPEPGPQVSAKTLEDISEYLSSQLQGKIGKVIPRADTAGPGVVEIQTAVTGVAVDSEHLHHIDLDRRRVEGEPLSLDRQRVGIEALERPPVRFLHFRGWGWKAHLSHHPPRSPQCS